MDIKTMQERLVAINARAQEIRDAGNEETGFTQEQSDEIKKLLDEAEDLKGKIQNARVADSTRLTDGINDLGTYLDQPAQQQVPPAQPQNHAAQPTEHYQPARPQNTPRIQMRMHHGGLRAFKGGERDIETAYRIGMFFNATVNRNERALRWCRDHGVTYRNQQLESVNLSGGVFVPEEMSQRIIDLRDSYGVFRANTTIEPMGSSSKTVNRRKSGLTAEHVGEAGTTTRTTAQWDTITLTARKVSVYASMSEEVEEDSVVDLADRLTDEAAYAMAVREDSDAFDGDGTSTYGGIVGLLPKIIDGNHAAGAVDAASGTDTMAEIANADIINLMSALPEVARRRGGNKWYMSSYAYDQVAGRLSLAGGGNTIANYAEGWRPMFMGAPVELTETLPGAGTINNTGMIAYGNPALASTMGSRRDMRVKISTDHLFATDEIALKFTERYDIVWHDLGDGTTAGPVVVLIGNT